MWLALGVVVNPALAIPYATGTLVFFTNLNNVRNSLVNWQKTIVDEVLERLLPYLKSQLSVRSFAEVASKIVEEVIDGLISKNSSSETASDFLPLLDTLASLRANLQSDNPQDNINLRKLKEAEISMLLRSMWTSIREELGLSERNIFIAVISSSLVLGLLLIFIFIGIIHYISLKLHISSPQIIPTHIHNTMQSFQHTFPTQLLFRRLCLR